MSVFLAKIINGEPDFGSEYNGLRFKQFCKDNEGKEIRISKISRKRSLNQNDFYWFYLNLIEKETGNDSNDLHQYFKGTLLSPRIGKVLGKVVKLARSTTSLNKIEFGDYLDKISALTLIPIPDVELYKKLRDEALLL